MKTISTTAVLALCLLVPGFARSVDTPEQGVATFKPYALVGDWQFVNSNTGVRYGGDVKVQITGVDAAGVMRGTVSYDGRQTNDGCSTRGIVSDEPVAAEVVKTKDIYRISFMINCLLGKSPRRFSWTLTCENDTCVRPEVAAHGRGALSLKEVR